jgi:hypothetical protein
MVSASSPVVISPTASIPSARRRSSATADCGVVINQQDPERSAALTAEGHLDVIEKTWRQERAADFLAGWRKGEEKGALSRRDRAYRSRRLPGASYRNSSPTGGCHPADPSVPQDRGSHRL